MTTYEISDGESTETIEADDMDDARKQAEAWARGGEWGMDEDGATTVWIDVSIRAMGADEGEEKLCTTPEIISDISDRTGFDHGDEFDDEADVRRYFTVDGMTQMLGEGHGLTQDVLDTMANEVINHHWHMATSESEEDSITVEIQPPEPDCTDGGSHDWQSPQHLVGGLDENPGVQGHGGGVICEEVCMRCGTARTTDTWADNPRGREGLTSVSYEVGKYEEQVAADDDE